MTCPLHPDCQRGITDCADEGPTLCPCAECSECGQRHYVPSPVGTVETPGRVDIAARTFTCEPCLAEVA